jgi:hypothetical protein
MATRRRKQDEWAGEPKKTQEIIEVLYTNAQRVQGKIGELTAVAKDINTAIILLTKTRYNGTVDNTALTIPGYTW